MVDATATFLLAVSEFFGGAAGASAEAAAALVLGTVAAKLATIGDLLGSTAATRTKATVALVVDAGAAKLATIAGFFFGAAAAGAVAAVAIATDALAAKLGAIVRLCAAAYVVGTGPEGGDFVGTVPAKAEVDVVGVGVGAGVRGPCVRAAVRAPDPPIPDHVHDAQTSCHGVFVALAIGGQQPLDQSVSDVLLGEGRDAPIEGAAFFVLALAPDATATDDAVARGARVSGEEEVFEGDDTGLCGGVAGGLSDVARVSFDATGETTNRRELGACCASRGGDVNAEVRGVRRGAPLAEWCAAFFRVCGVGRRGEATSEQGQERQQATQETQGPKRGAL